MRIISLAPSVTEVIFALGQEHNLVANTIFCDFPTVSKKIPKVGSWTQLNYDKIATFNPDIIFTSTIVQAPIAEQLKSQGYSVIHQDPRTLKQIYRSFQTVADILNVSAKGEQLVEDMQVEEAQIRGAGLQLKNKPKVYIEEWFHPPMMSGNWVPELVTLAGGTYGIIPPGEISREISREEVEQYDPDIVLLSYCGFNTASNPVHIQKREGWNALRAMRSDMLAALDDRYLNRPGPRVLQAAKEIQQYLKSC